MNALLLSLLVCIAGDLPKGFEVQGGEIKLPTGEQISGVPREVGQMVLIVGNERVGIYNPGARKFEWKELPTLPSGVTLTPIERSTGKPDTSVCFIQVRDMSTTGGEVKGVIRFKPPRALDYFPVVEPAPNTHRILGWRPWPNLDDKLLTSFPVEGLPENFELRLSERRGHDGLRIKKIAIGAGGDRPNEVQREINSLTLLLHETEGRYRVPTVKDMHLVPKAEGKLDPVTRGVATWKYNALLIGQYQMNEFGGVEVKGPKYQEDVLRCELILEHGIEPRETRPGKFEPKKLTATRRGEIEEELAELKKKQQAALLAATSQQEE